MSTEAPLVSVIIPTYDAGRFVAQAVQSVFEQTYPQYEVIVVDDGSTDGTKDVLRKFDNQIKYFYQENRGPSAARNLGIKNAAGEYICFLDADDLWTPTKLEAHISFMEVNPHIGLVFSDYEEFDDNSVTLKSFLADRVFGRQLIPYTCVQEAFEKLLVENFIPTPTVTVRKQCFAKAGLFDESVRSVEDLDMWLRISAYFEIACIPLILCRRRLHGSNISRHRELGACNQVRVLENNRGRFPKLAPTGVWNRRLADSYLQLGYLLLAENRKRDALQAGFKGLKHAQSLAIQSRSSSSYSWSMVVGSIVAPLVGWQIARALWRTKNRLLPSLGIRERRAGQNRG